MNIYYDSSTNEVVIRDVEKIKKKTVNHTFKGVPLAYQYHPHFDHKNQIIRVQFEGRCPNWLKNKYRAYQTDVAVAENQVGWWLSTWNSNTYGVFVTPSLQGAISMMIDSIPEELQELRDKVEANRDIIVKNLQMDGLLYGPSMYYRCESVNRIQGALYISPDILVKQAAGEERDTYIKRFLENGFPELVEDLIDPLDYEEEDEEELDECEDEPIEVAESTEDEWEEDTLTTEIIEVAESTEDEWEEDTLTTEITEVAESTEGDEGRNEPVKHSLESLGVIHEPVTDIEGVYKEMGLHVAKITSKRGDSMEGQLVFF